MKMGYFRAAIIAFACTLAAASADLHPFSDEFINLINFKQTSWKAGKNFSPNTPMNRFKRLAYHKFRNFNHGTQQTVEYSNELLASLPENFDPRQKWPNCPSLNEIRDQGSCAGSWAFAAVEAMTDRVCIYSNGTRQFHFSAEDLISCCSNCGGCGRGKPDRAWSHWKSNGIVSGGNYNSNEGCRPYSIPTCDHHKPGVTKESTGDRLQCSDQNVEAPKCTRTCDANSQLTYKNDKMFGKRSYTVELEIYIKAELFLNGPVEAVFWMYADFFNYKSGVYDYSGVGNFIEMHAVKIMGWGVENGTKYWLAANSWGQEWGDNGFFKIHRGENRLGITSNIHAGEPLLISN